MDKAGEQTAVPPSGVVSDPGQELKKAIGGEIEDGLGANRDFALEDRVIGDDGRRDAQNHAYRESKEEIYGSDGDTSTTSEESLESGEEEDDYEEGGDEIGTGDAPKEPSTQKSGRIRSKNEIIDRAVADFDILLDGSLPLTQMGVILSIVEDDIVVSSTRKGLENVLSESSALFLENRRCIGKISEVFGRMDDPMYLIKRNSGHKEAKVGDVIYFTTHYGKYLEKDEYTVGGGTDASNQYDEEVSDEEADFSDDEKEREKRVQLAKQRRKNRGAESGESAQRRLRRRVGPHRGGGRGSLPPVPRNRSEFQQHQQYNPYQQYQHPQ